VKTIIKRSILFTVIFFSLFVSTIVLADPPGPPNPGGTPVGTGTPVGAPVDGGVVILIILGGAYGAIKLYQSRKEKKLQVPEM